MILSTCSRVKWSFVIPQGITLIYQFKLPISFSSSPDCVMMGIFEGIEMDDTETQGSRDELDRLRR